MNPESEVNYPRMHLILAPRFPDPSQNTMALLRVKTQQCSTAFRPGAFSHGTDSAGHLKEFLTNYLAMIGCCIPIPLPWTNDRARVYHRLFPCST